MRQINKILVLLFTVFLSSCIFGSPPLTNVNTEILCPHIGQKILIQHVTSEEFWESLNKFHDARMKRGSSENYTVLVFRNRYSMQLKGIKSEDMLGCYRRDVFLDNIPPDYLIY